MSKVHCTIALNWNWRGNIEKPWKRKRIQKNMLVLIVVMANQLGRKCICQFSASVMWHLLFVERFHSVSFKRLFSSYKQDCGWFHPHHILWAGFMLQSSSGFSHPGIDSKYLGSHTESQGSWSISESASWASWSTLRRNCQNTISFPPYKYFIYV